MYATGSSRIGLAFRSRPTAPTQACTWDRAATKSQNDPIRAERLRGRAWRDATSCTASSGVYSRAPRLCPLETEDLSRKTGTPALAQRVLVLREKTLNRQQGPNGEVLLSTGGTTMRNEALSVLRAQQMIPRKQLII